MHVAQSQYVSLAIGKRLSLPIGSYGVTLFFVISGFLITYLLLTEKAQSGSVKIGNFYMRRILRIWPLYYLFILLAIIVYWLNGRVDSIVNSELWFILFFTPNVLYGLQTGVRVLAHYWSLGVEEQFYLFWPWIVKYSKNLFRWAMIFGILFFIVKTALWFYDSSSVIYRMFNYTRFHCMMVGALGALLYYRGKFLIIDILAKRWIQLISWILFFGIGFNLIYIPGIISHEIFALASMSLIFGQIVPGKSLINLENKICNFVGKISYGVYIYHPLWILLFSLFMNKIGVSPNTAAILIFPVVLSLTLLTAHFSHKYFERPFLKMKDKYSYTVKATNI